MDLGERMSDTTETTTRPAHAIDSDGTVMIGAAAGLDDLLTAMRAAAVGNPQTFHELRNAAGSSTSLPHGGEG